MLVKYILMSFALREAQAMGMGPKHLRIGSGPENPLSGLVIDSNQLRERRVYLFICLDPSLSWREIRAGTWRQKLETHGGMPFTGSLFMACADCFLIPPGPPAQGWDHPQGAGSSNLNQENVPQIFLQANLM